MGIRLSFEITSPLGPDDKELLMGSSIMTLASANHELAKAPRAPACLRHTVSPLLH